MGMALVKLSYSVIAMEVVWRKLPFSASQFYLRRNSEIFRDLFFDSRHVSSLGLSLLGPSRQTRWKFDAITSLTRF
jgi:hypothetical protein